MILQWLFMLDQILRTRVNSRRSNNSNPEFRGVIHAWTGIFVRTAAVRAQLCTVTFACNIKLNSIYTDSINDISKPVLLFKYNRVSYLLQVFIAEQLLYTSKDLARHQQTGDIEGVMAESGFKGHPSCRSQLPSFYILTLLLFLTSTW